MGWLTERGGSTYRLAWGMMANLVGGIVALSAPGIAGIALVTGISVQAAAVSTWISIPGHLVKAALRRLVARASRGHPGLLGRTRAETQEPSTV